MVATHTYHHFAYSPTQVGADAVTLAKYCASVIGWVSDFGTEAELPVVPAINLQDRHTPKGWVTQRQMKFLMSGVQISNIIPVQIEVKLGEAPGLILSGEKTLCFWISFSAQVRLPRFPQGPLQEQFVNSWGQALLLVKPSLWGMPAGFHQSERCRCRGLD